MQVSRCLQSGIFREHFGGKGIKVDGIINKKLDHFHFRNLPKYLWNKY